MTVAVKTIVAPEAMSSIAENKRPVQEEKMPIMIDKSIMLLKLSVN